MTRLMILHLWVLFIFQIRLSSIQANPNKVGCTLIGDSGRNVMTRTSIMGATPNGVSNLISFSSNTYSSGGQQITVTIQNLQSGGAVIHSDKGSLTKPTGFDDKGCSGTNTLYHKQNGVSTSYTLTLTVPSDISNVNSITISVITAAGYGAISRQAKSLTKSGVTSPTPASGGTSPSPASGGTSPSTSTSLSFDSKYSMSYSTSSDSKSVTFTLTLSGGRSWMALGVSPDGSMINSGSGSDVVICSSGSVKRFWITSYSVNWNTGTDVTGATCSQSADKSVMTFTRNVDGGSQKHPLKLGGTETQFIWAYSADGNTAALAQHSGATRGAKSINLKTGKASVAETSVKATMFLHGVCMALAWSVLLPSGVLVAHFEREKEGTFNGVKYWFGYHRTVQYIGWFVQLLGFVFVVVYVSAKGGVHFGGLHTYIGLAVTILGTLQPLNAYFRPHAAEEGKAKSSKRQYWEWLHKGSGYIACILGMLNVLIGVYFAHTLFKNGALTGLAGGLLGVGLVCCLIYASMKCIKNRNTPAKKSIAL